MEDWGVPTAIAHLNELYIKLETVRGNLGKFVSYDDEARDLSETSSLLGDLHFIIVKLEDTADSIRIKVDSLLEEEPK